MLLICGYSSLSKYFMFILPNFLRKFCPSLMGLRKMIEEYYSRQPSIGDLAFSEAILNYNFSPSVISEVQSSPFEDITLLEFITALGNQFEAELFQDDVVLNSFGLLTLDEIFINIIKNNPDAVAPKILETYGKNTLNDVAECHNF